MSHHDIISRNVTYIYKYHKIPKYMYDINYFTTMYTYMAFYTKYSYILLYIG